MQKIKQTGTILDQIVEARVDSINKLKQDIPLGNIIDEINKLPEPISFYDCLNENESGNMNLIAEFKVASPSKGIFIGENIETSIEKYIKIY